MSPELLKQIEARVTKSTIVDRDYLLAACADRRALLNYCRELEADRDSIAKTLIEERDLTREGLDWVNDWHHGDLGSLHAPPHLAPILEASRKRINGKSQSDAGVDHGN